MPGNQNTFKKCFIFLYPLDVAEGKHCPRRLRPEVSSSSFRHQLRGRWAGTWESLRQRMLVRGRTEHGPTSGSGCWPVGAVKAHSRQPGALGITGAGSQRASELTRFLSIYLLAL